MRLSLITLAFAIAMFNCMAQRTTRKNLNVKPTADTTIMCDTLTNTLTDILIISGYDKPLTSHYETFFATNKGSTTITTINIKFNYFDNQNRQLHSATRNISCLIPPGETRLISISSWDKQKSFYYFRSAKPRRQATSYSVTHSINYIITNNK